MAFFKPHALMNIPLDSASAGCQKSKILILAARRRIQAREIAEVRALAPRGLSREIVEGAVLIDGGCGPLLRAGRSLRS
jgi:hypothetical protein